MKVTNIAGEDLSYLSPAIMVLGFSLCNVPLETDARVPFELMGSSRHQASRRLRLRDEADEEAEDGKKVTIRPQRKRKKEVFEAFEVFFEEKTQSIDLLEVPIATLRLGEDPSKNASSLKEVAKLIRRGLVKKPGFESVCRM